jgi:hypothetical protein
LGWGVCPHSWFMIAPAVPLEQSVTFQELGALVNALNGYPANFTLVKQASIDCIGAPDVALDTVFVCSEELVTYLNRTLQQVRGILLLAQ